MSIEALWAVQFTGVNGQHVATSGGVIVVETGRIFGGDTWQFYTGTYERRNDGIGLYNVDIKTGVHFHVGGQSIFGTTLSPMHLVGEITVLQDNRAMSAKLVLADHPGVWLTATLTRVAELP